MPLKRYEIRNEYSLADPELYKVADKDDPEAILEGVAMAGLVGLLRQLGDLAQFAAEIFHDLHEEVMSTAARGHGLSVRVQQLEAEFPLIERKLLSQTSHTSYLYNSSVDWHSNLRLDQNTITQGVLPRFVMDSYEECRGPPRLFLLDKFDVAGAGACLKRFTDPSFFKTESASSTGRKLEIQREKKTRRVKKRGPRWRNGETPESFPSSHAKLHQLFLEERVESGGNDPDRRVKLKRRQFTGSLFDQETTKSYMEKFLDTCPPEQRIVHEIIDPLPLTWTSNNASESSLEIVEFGKVSPLQESIEYGRRLCSSPDTGDIAENPPIDEFIGRNSDICSEGEAAEVFGVNCSSNDGNVSSTITQVVNGDDFADRESKSGVSIDDWCVSGDVASEIDDYVDALATIESEVDTDIECNNHALNLKPIVVDCDGSLEQPGLLGGYIDSLSVSNSATFEGGNNLVREGGSSSLSNSVISLAVDTADNENAFSDCRFALEEITDSETEKHAMAHVADFKANGVPKAWQGFGDISSTSCLPNTKVFSLDMDADLTENYLQTDEFYSSSAENYMNSRERDQGHASIATCLANRTVLDFAEKAYSGHQSSDYSIHEESGHISGVYSDNLADAQNISGSLQIEPHNAHSVCSSIEEHTKDMGQADVDAFSDSTWSLGQLSIFDNECPEKVDTIRVPKQGGFTNPFSALDSEKSFNIQEKNSETKHSTPSPDVIATLCSKEDSSFGVASDPAEQGQRLSSSHTALQSEKSTSICNKLQDAAPELSSSGNTEEAEIVGYISFANGVAPKFSFSGNTKEAEIVEYSSFANGVAGIDSSGNIIVGEIFPGCSDGKIMDDALVIGKPSSSLDLLKSEDGLQNLQSEINDVDVLVHCQAEAGELDPGNEITLKGDAVSIGKVGMNATVNLLESDAVCQELIKTSLDQTKVVEMTSHLDGCQTNAVDVVARSDKIEDENIDFSNATSLLKSDIPCKHAYETDVENLEPVETTTDSSIPANCKGDHNKKVGPLSSTLHPEMFQDQLLLVTEECHQNGDELTKGHREELTQNGHMNPVNVSIDVSPSVLLHGMLPQDFENWGNLIIDTPLASKDSVQYVESASSEQIHLLEEKDNYVDPRRHGLLKSLLPGKAVDLPSRVTPLYCEHGVYFAPDNFSKDVQTPEYVKRDGYIYAPTAYNQCEPQRLEATTESSVRGMIIGANHALGPERQLVCPPDFPVLSTAPSDPLTNLEAPPLPPLPPMQWRLGRLQNSSSAPERQLMLPRAGEIQVPPSGQSSWNEGQPGSSDELHGGVTMPMVPAISEGFSVPSTSYMALEGGLALPMLATFSRGSSHDNQLFFVPSTSTGPQSGTQIFENFHQPHVTPPKSGSFDDGPSENADLGASIELHVPNFTGQEVVNSSVQFLPPSTVHQPSAGVVASQAERAWMSTYDGIPTHASGNTNSSLQKKLLRPRNPLIDEVVAIDKSKFRKVERVKPSLKKAEEGESLLEQMQLRKVEKVEPPAETNASEGEYVLEQLQLRKVQRVKPPIEPKSEEWEFLLEQLQLKKIGERYKPEAEPKAEETDSPHVQLRKVSERVKQEIEARTEEMGSPRVQLRKVGDRVKQELDARPVETGSPRVQLRKVDEKVKQEIQARTEETESPRVQLRKVGEKTHSVVESKTEERDSLFEQIRNKSFSLKPAIAARPNIQGPRTNLKVAAILEKASNIRQAIAGSDEDDDADIWE